MREFEVLGEDSKQAELRLKVGPPAERSLQAPVVGSYESYLDRLGKSLM